MKKFIVIFIFCSLGMRNLSQGQEKMHHMLGYVDMCEACIWVQTVEPDLVSIHLHKKGSDSPEKIFEKETIGEYAHTSHIVLSQLEPGTAYEYAIHSKNDRTLNAAATDTFSFVTQALWQYRTDPPSFNVAAGSCAFINETEDDRPGEPYGGGYEIFESIVAKKPDAMLWLGDNVYLREVDFSSKAGIEHRYSHCRAVPEIQSLLRSCPNYAIWDDHDFGPNDSNGSFIHKDWTLDAFREFWANPSYGLPGKCSDNGITTQFQISDIEFFLLDNRYHRVAFDVKNAATPTILGEEQFNWLIASLKYSSAPFKIVAVGGQFLNTEKKYENFSNWAEERQKILDAIQANNIKGVVFLTGDRHCGELSELKLGNGEMVYDLTVSPLTSKANDMTKEQNALRVAGTIIPERHFATLGFDGLKGKRVMTISVFDAKGKLKYNKKISQSPN